MAPTADLYVATSVLSAGVVRPVIKTYIDGVYSTVHTDYSHGQAAAYSQIFVKADGTDELFASSGPGVMPGLNRDSIVTCSPQVYYGKGVPMTPGNIGTWNFNETLPTDNAIDESGKGHTLTRNGVSGNFTGRIQSRSGHYILGKARGAYWYDGNYGDWGFVRNTNFDTDFQPSSFSLGIWYIDDGSWWLGPGQGQNFILNWDDYGAGPDTSIELAYRSDGTHAHPYAKCRTLTNTNLTILGASNLDVKGRHHLGLTYDESIRTMELWFDGVSQGKAVAPGPLAPMRYYTLNNNRFNVCDTFGTAHGWEGWVDQICFSNIAYDAGIITPDMSEYELHADVPADVVKATSYGIEFPVWTHIERPLNIHSASTGGVHCVYGTDTKTLWVGGAKTGVYPALWKWSYDTWSWAQEWTTTGAGDPFYTTFTSGLSFIHGVAEDHFIMSADNYGCTWDYNAGVVTPHADSKGVDPAMLGISWNLSNLTEAWKYSRYTWDGATWASGSAPASSVIRGIGTSKFGGHFFCGNDNKIYKHVVGSGSSVAYNAGVALCPCVVFDVETNEVVTMKSGYSTLIFSADGLVWGTLDIGNDNPIYGLYSNQYVPPPPPPIDRKARPTARVIAHNVLRLVFDVDMAVNTALFLPSTYEVVSLSEQAKQVTVLQVRGVHTDNEDFTRSAKIVDLVTTAPTLDTIYLLIASNLHNISGELVTDTRALFIAHEAKVDSFVAAFPSLYQLHPADGTLFQVLLAMSLSDDEIGGKDNLRSLPEGYVLGGSVGGLGSGTLGTFTLGG